MQVLNEKWLLRKRGEYAAFILLWLRGFAAGPWLTNSESEVVKFLEELLAEVTLNLS